MKLALGERVVRRAAPRSGLPTARPAWSRRSTGPISRSSGCSSRQNRGVGAKPILELNMKHALVKALGSAQKSVATSDVNDLSALLFEQAQILDGEVPDDPAAFAARLNRLVVRGLALWA